ncbi:hypothetical protein YC2023_107940 [Brassica napus]
MDRAQVPWKGAPERVRAPLCPDPVAPRGAVYELGCLGMQPQSDGKFHPRLNTGEGPIANKYRKSQRVLEIVGREADGGRRFVPVGCRTEQSGLPIDSGRGPMRIKVVTTCYARGDVAALMVVCSMCLTACLGICVLRASACGLPIRPVLEHGPRSLTCVQVNG